MGTKSSYANRRQQSQEEKDQQVLQHEVKQAELQLQSDILATELSVSNAEQAVESAKSSPNFSSTNIITAQDDLDSAKRGLKALLDLRSELFPAGK